MIGPAPPPPPTFSSIVRVRDVSYLTLVHPDRAVCRLGPGTIPLEIAHAAALSALAARDAFQAKVWAMLGCFFEAEAEAGTGQAALTSLVAERVVKDLMAYLIHLKDIQTLGLIACLLEIFTRGELGIFVAWLGAGGALTTCLTLPGQDKGTHRPARTTLGYTGRQGPTTSRAPTASRTRSSRLRRLTAQGCRPRSQPGRTAGAPRAPRAGWAIRPGRRASICRACSTRR